MQLPLDDLPEFPPRHRIGIKQRGLILRPSGDGPLAWSWARWSLVPPGARSCRLPAEQRPGDKLGAWPWKAVQRQRCLIPRAASGSRRSWPREGRGALVLLQHDGRAAVLHGGPVGRGVGPATGEVADTYTLIITDANATMRVHDRMPVILATGRGPAVDRARPAAGRAAGALPGRGDDGVAGRRRRQEQPDRAACGHGRAGRARLTIAPESPVSGNPAFQPRPARLRVVGNCLSQRQNHSRIGNNLCLGLLSSRRLKGTAAMLILIVEDEILIGMGLSLALGIAGHRVRGPAGSVERAGDCGQEPRTLPSST